MLEGLDDVNWSALEHAYGEAGDVPELLRQLAFGTATEQDSAIDALYGNIWHQGTVYEAAAAAIPFLIEIVDSPSAEVRTRVLKLLFDLGRGHSYHDVHQSLSWVDETTEEYQDQIATELRWVTAAHEAVIAGTPTFLRCLDSHDPTEVAFASQTLTLARTRAGEILPLTMALLGRRADGVTRSALIWLAAVLTDDGSATVDLLTGLLPAEPTPEGRAAIRLLLVAATGRRLAVEHVALLAQDLAVARLPKRLPLSHVLSVRGAVDAAGDDLASRVLLVDRLLHSTSPSVRGEALEAAADLNRMFRPPDRTLVATIGGLTADDTDADIRFTAARSLREFRPDAEVADVLVAVLATDPDPDVRAAAGLTLTAWRDPRVISWVKNAELPDGFHSRVPSNQSELLDPLGPFGEQLIPDLIRVARSVLDHRLANPNPNPILWVDPAVSRLKEVVEVLARFGGVASDAVPVLTDAIQSGVAVTACVDALIAIGPAARGSLDAVRVAADDASTAILEAAIQGHVVEARDIADTNGLRYEEQVLRLSSLGRLAAPYIPALEHSLRTSDDPHRTTVAALALAEIGVTTPEVTTALATALHSAMYERPPGGGLTLRRIAHSVRSLGHHAAPLRADLEALASAERRFAAPCDDEEIQAIAIAALGAIGNEAT